VGLGSALSNTVGGVIADRYGFAASFLGLAAIALVAVALLVLAVPETGSRTRKADCVATL
ncbi:MAG TPA: MFS transporter, partial [Edaphobacter sp.]|nr:MFS transporter [Edaphobacter sp.]